jgi:hypothetical protein
MELSSSPRRSSRSPAIRHVVDSSCRKLKELTMRNLATAMVEELLEELMATEEVVVMMMIGAAAATVEVAMTNSLNSLLVYWLDSRYLSMTERNPVRTKAITSPILNFLGDFFCQVQQLSLLLPLHFTSFFPMKLSFFFCVPLEISFFQLQVFCKLSDNCNSWVGASFS